MSNQRNSPATGSSPNTSDGCYLFKGEKLTSLSKWPEIRATLAQKGLCARPLRLSDFSNGYLELLSQLTKVGNITENEFVERFNLMKRLNQVEDHYVIVVIEDVETEKIVGTTTLFLELKYIHECAMRGRLEDVAVLDTHRGKQIGETVVKIIVELAREAYKCYKLSLDCRDELVDFYAKNGFAYSNKSLCIRFDH